MVEALYTSDPAYHAQMEPLNATASVSDDGKSATVNTFDDGGSGTSRRKVAQLIGYTASRVAGLLEALRLGTPLQLDSVKNALPHRAEADGYSEILLFLEPSPARYDLPMAADDVTARRELQRNLVLLAQQARSPISLNPTVYILRRDICNTQGYLE